jgi:tight adherence protein C
MGLAIFSFLAIFLLIGSLGLLLFYRVEMLQRLSHTVSPRPERKLSSYLNVERAGDSLKTIVKPFDKVLPKSQAEVSVLQRRLIRAGYREDGTVRIFYGAKVLVPLALCVIVTATGLAENNAFFVYAVSLALGFLAPDFWLGRRIAARQTNIRLGLPEFLDLMVICIEAGLSMDHAMMRSVNELTRSQPELADELALVNLEQRAGRPRLEAWQNLAERVDIDVVRALVSSIKQADQFGTSVAKILRVQSDTLRVQRRQRVEEIAAKMAVKMVFPLVLFIFPSLFIVAMGPAIIVMQDSMQKYFS